MVRVCMIVAVLHFSIIASAQNTIKQDTTAKKDRKINFSGMLLTRFTQSFDKGIDINGKHHSEETGYSTSSFSIRRARFQTKAQLNTKVEAVLLLNLTDFIGNPSNKVVENAFIKYHFNKFLNLQVGQYRPYFGREDLYPEDLLQALEWSNSYYAFGANGWQSFQEGTTVFGKVNVLKIPVSYYVGVFNGNGKNQLMDNDNGKLFPVRIELAVRPQTKIGLNGGLGKDGDNKVWACNFDVDHIQKLSENWEFEIQSEYKRGINNSQFDTCTTVGKQMSNFQLGSWYVLPNLKYNINSGQIKSLEFSCRYETLNCDTKGNGNSRQTWMPVVSLQLANEYFLKFETGLIIDKYNATSLEEHDGTRLVCQMQARF